VAERRALLLPREATNEGARRLRELLRKQTFGGLARRLRCDERSVRSWAREENRPSLVMRARIAEVLGILEDAWDAAPASDVYEPGADPPTARHG